MAVHAGTLITSSSDSQAYAIDHRIIGVLFVVVVAVAVLVADEVRCDSRLVVSLIDDARVQVVD